jgi:ornithine carbamoyltransferase
MSYHVPAEELEARLEALKAFQVDEEKMEHGAPSAIFMNCLPALRGYEQTAAVIDGPQSVVFDQAENRLHTQKAIMVTLLREA